MKNLLKKIMIALLASCSLTTSVFASDISDWAKVEYNSANEAALIPYSIIIEDMTGYITRVEFCDLIMNTYQKLTGEELINPTVLPFKDTDSLSVSQAYYYGIVQGDETGLFNPHRNITRQEMAKMIVNLLISAEIKFEISEEINPVFTDLENVSEWSEYAISTVIENQILNGYDNLIEPHAYTTRQQAVVSLARLYNKYAQQKEYHIQPQPILHEDIDNNLFIINWQSIYQIDKYLVIIKDKTNKIIYGQETTENYLTLNRDFFTNNTEFSVTISAVLPNNNLVCSLPIDYKMDSFETPADKIVKTAECYLGTPYVWGGTTPNGFDCSGFVQYVYGQNGYTLTRTTYTQWDCDGKYVSRNELIPGDLVYFGKNGSPSHVGLYVGNGTMIHSPQTGDVVKYTPIDSGYYAPRFIGGKRIIS